MADGPMGITIAISIAITAATIEIRNPMHIASTKTSPMQKLLRTTYNLSGQCTNTHTRHVACNPQHPTNKRQHTISTITHNRKSTTCDAGLLRYIILHHGLSRYLVVRSSTVCCALHCLAVMLQFVLAPPHLNLKSEKIRVPDDTCDM